MSTVKANDLTNVTGGIPTVKSQQLIPTAWVKFNGTGTVNINDSENVSSITDLSTGTYTINFIVAMSNTSYSVADSDGDWGRGWIQGWTTGSVQTRRRNESGGYVDAPHISIIVLGGQS